MAKRGIEEQEYHVAPVEGKDQARRSYQAPNRKHNIRTYFNDEGITLQDRTAANNPALVSLGFKGLGRGASLLLSGGEPPEIRAEKNRIELRRQGIIEWYINRADGLEQGFEIPQRPPGEGELSLILEARGAVLRVAGDKIVITSPTGRKLEYGKLQITDGNGKTVSGRLELKGTDRIVIAMDDAGARYPLSVDPLITGIFDTMLEADQAGASFGFSIAGAGDVNNDGYADVIVGAPNYDNGQTDEGAAFVYLGGATGVATIAAAVLESNQAGSSFGWSVAGAGDVNNDGYADIIVGAYLYDNGQLNEGAAFIYHGSYDGVVTTAARMLESDQAGAWFGYSVSGTGDVNMDGYADIIVGAYLYDSGQTDEGAAFVYHGSAAGVAATAAARLESNQAGAWLGTSVAGAGDVDGDGFADVIVGAQHYTNGQTNEGAAFVYHGSATGVALTAAVQLESDQAGAESGISVAGAGDVNNDGYADVIVGAYLYDSGQTDEGVAFVYHGSATGILTTPGATLEANQGGAWFGISVAGAGDVNGDGYADVVVGASNFSDGQNYEGAAFVYHGSAGGVATTADMQLESDQASAWFGVSVAGAGDVNGDGFADVIVGAFGFDNGQTDEGAAFVYHGTTTYTVTATAGDHGSLDTVYITSPQTVMHGETTSFKFDADADYHVASVSGCGVDFSNSQVTVTTYTATTAAVYGGCVVAATFSNTGSISGTVTDPNNGDAPLEGIQVIVSSNPCDSTTRINTAVTQSDGSYTVYDLAPGSSYYVHTRNNAFTYVYAWHADPDNVTDCNAADPILVSASQDASGIDFGITAPSGTFTAAQVFSENIQFDAADFPLAQTTPYVNGVPYWRMVAAANIAGSSAENPVSIDSTETGSRSLQYLGAFGSFANLSVGLFNDFAIAPYGGPYHTPDEAAWWENKSYEFSFGDTRGIFYIPGGSLHQLPIPQNVGISGADHPTVTWSDVEGADYYQVWILTLKDDYPDQCIFMSSAILKTPGEPLSYTYPGALLAGGGSFAIRVLAFQKHPYWGIDPLYTYKPVNRSAYVTRHNVTYTVTATAGANGSLDTAFRSSPQTVFNGGTISFKFDADSGYRVATVSGCGISYTNGLSTVTTYEATTSAVTADCTVTATFANTYSVTATAGANGSLDTAYMTSPQTVVHGGTTSFKFDAAAGYHVASISGCGISYTNSVVTVTTHTVTTGSVTTACEVTAAFALHPPAAPVQVSPNGIGNSTTPTYTFKPVAGATSYRIYLWNTTLGSGITMAWVSAATAGCSDEIANCAILQSPALADGPYSWYVMAQNAVGVSPWSSAMNFSVGTLPVAPIQVSPVGSIISATPTYTFKPVAGANMYRVYLWNKTLGSGTNTAWITPSGAGCANEVSNCTIVQSPALANGPYEWYVRAQNPLGIGPWSTAMNFTSGPPLAPIQVSPSGLNGSATPTYTFKPVVGVTLYRIYLWNKTLGSGITMAWVTPAAAGCANEVSNCTIAQSPALANGPYEWYVRAQNIAGTGPWSATMNFNVGGPPVAPVQISPSGSANSTTPAYT
ncbi:MAG: FG-GAP-like repeat-containing protein, partial [Candidatus Methylomirabilia bacterium]